MSADKPRERQAAERAKFLSRTADISDREALAVAYREMGYSDAGIAECIDSTRGTVRNYLDAVADEYGVTAVQPTPEDERGRLSEPETRVDMDTPTGRCVVLNGDADAAAERYYRTWTRDGRVNRGEKLALRFKEYSERRNGRLNSMDWDEHHIGYDDTYTFARAGVTGEGAWTCDADRATRRALRDRDISIPLGDSLPLVATVHAYRFDEHRRTCPVCEADSVCSARDLDAFPRAEWGDAMEVCRESDVVTHLCTSCRRMLVNVVEFVDDGDDDGSGDVEDALLEAMH